MVFGARNFKYWVLGPCGSDTSNRPQNDVILEATTASLANDPVQVGSLSRGSNKLGGPTGEVWSRPRAQHQEPKDTAEIATAGFLKDLRLLQVGLSIPCLGKPGRPWEGLGDRGPPVDGPPFTFEIQEEA